MPNIYTRQEAEKRVVELLTRHATENRVFAETIFIFGCPGIESRADQDLKFWITLIGREADVQIVGGGP